MSKNISIKVGGVSRNFSNVPKIQTEEALTGDTINWIPEDEANDYAITESARITENGTYHPSSGKCGFNEVVVNVSGGGGTLVEKTITENGDYYAVDDNADGYSKVTVNVASQANIMTSAEWEALTYEEKVASGLTIIRNNEGDFKGVWYNYAYDLPVDIVCEYFGAARETFDMTESYSHLIMWKGNWRATTWNAYSNARVDKTDITLHTTDHGVIVNYYDAPTVSNYQTTIFDSIEYGESPSFSFWDSNNQPSYAVVIGVKPESDITILAEYCDTLTHTYTFENDYDAVVVLGTKTSYLNADSINVMTGDYATGKAGDEFAINAPLVPMTQIFSGVKADSVVTTQAIPNNNMMGSVIIGINFR